MVLDLLKDSEKVWREIVRLARPIDSDKKVVITSEPKPSGDFEAWTDNKKIYINLSNEKNFKKNFENIVIPAYRLSAKKLYDTKKPVSDLELLTNLVFDTFLFVHFHEQLHPWLCPNSRADEKTISKALFEGIKEAEPSLSKAQILYKVNNSKNLIWDTVLNISFISKTSSYDNLEQKISFVFKKNNRKIDYQPVTKYPSGIVPALYITSAQNRKTDIPISLIGSLYATMSYNDPGVREKAMDIFLDDLQSKKLPEAAALDIIKKMYRGFVSEIKPSELKKKGIDIDEYKKRIHYVTDFTNPNYENNQKYFVTALTKIFDTTSMRYDSLKGLIKVLSPYMSLTQKQGSPDQNTSSYGSGGSEEDSSGAGSGEGETDDDSDGKSEKEMDEDSMSQTLDDLTETLNGDEADDLMEEVANGSGQGTGPGRPSHSIRKKISIIAADKYYKKHAYVIEVKNPSQENVAFDVGNRKRWTLVRTQNLTAVQVSKLSYKQIMAFQKLTGLPVLMDVGNGYYKLNEYRLEELPLKSYTSQKTGIEIPDNWVLFQDSSGSMTSTTNYVSSGNRFDTLNMVKYGIKKGLYDVCKALKKDLKFGVVDFSNNTDYKGIDSLIKIYESRTHPVKEISLTPQCGGTVCDSKVFKRIEKDLAPGKTIYTFITDGQIGGDTHSLYKEIERFAAKENNAFVFVEIASSSMFGSEIKQLSKKNPSVLYYSVSNVKSIKDKLSSVLIRYS